MSRTVTPQVVTVHVLDGERHPACGAPRVDDVWQGDVPSVCVECVVVAITTASHRDERIRTGG